MLGLFFVYILKSSVCLAVFYLFYRLLLSSETFHRFNRIALMGLMLLSCLIPLMEVTVQEATEVNRPFLSLEELLLMSMAEGGGVAEAGAAGASFPWREAVLLGYVAGIFFFLARHLWSLARMLRLLRHCRKERLDSGIILYIHDEKIAPFSWMRKIVISEADLREDGKTIVTHETAHICNRHSYDLLLAEVCIFLQWFNPAAWLLKQELQNIHEYEVDGWVIGCGIDAKTYQLLLIKKAVGARLYSIANSFNHSSLKKRITMMIKKKSNPWARLKYLYVLPLAAVAVAAFARPEISEKLDEISSVKVNDLTSIMKAEEVKSVENLSEEKVKVSGTVLDADTRKPMAGASVLVKGTTLGTLTDDDGKFTLSVRPGDILMCSFAGYQTTTLVADDFSARTVEIPLKVLSHQLEEMTIVGMNNVSQEEGPNGKVVSVTDIPRAKEPQAMKDGVYQVVEEMPQFPGGMQECLLFLSKNIRYPEEAQTAKVEGRVIVQFVVQKDGTVSETRVVRCVSPELDAEALRVMDMMPKWIPGKQKGQPVPVKYTLPIMFRLQKEPVENSAVLVNK